MNALKRLVKRLRYLKRLYRGVRDQLDRNMPLNEIQWSFKLSGHRFMVFGGFEQEETTSVRKYLSDIDFFVNAGANIGYYVYHALSLQKEVIAIEPVRHNVHYLMKNVHANGLSPNVEFYPIAAGEKQGILPVRGGGTGASLLKGAAKLLQNGPRPVWMAEITQTENQLRRKYFTKMQEPLIKAKREVHV